MSGAICCVYWLYAAVRIGTFGREILMKRGKSQLGSLEYIRRCPRGVVCVLVRLLS